MKGNMRRCTSRKVCSIRSESDVDGSEAPGEEIEDGVANPVWRVKDSVGGALPPWVDRDGKVRGWLVGSQEWRKASSAERI